MLNKKALSASASVAAAKVYVEDVFATHIYDGTGATQTITNGIDLSGKGGLVWIKSRSGTTGHRFTDTVRGATKSLASETTAAEATESTGLTSFGTTGFTIGADADYNTSGAIYTSWTFREQSKFFDIVTYTGNGSNRTISHNLGSVPGCIIVKRTDTTGAWQVYHRSLANTEYLVLNTTDAKATGTTRWNSTTPTSTVFSLGTDATVNANNGTYVAYLFAHDAGGFGDNGDQNVITCGSYTGDGTDPGPTITLGYEPQWVLIKKVSNNTNAEWFIADNVRGSINYQDVLGILYPNAVDAELNGISGAIAPLPDGFRILSNASRANESNSVYIYIAIRRGPMKTPTDATKVFQPVVYTGTNVDNRLINTTIAPDFVMIRQRNDTVVPGMYTGTRLTGSQFMITGSTAVGATDLDSFDAQLISSVEYGNNFSSMSGVWVGNDATRKFNANTTSNNHVIHAFKRAPGFFDVVRYTGTGGTAARNISHNLGAVPQLMIVKRTDSTVSWAVYNETVGNTKFLTLNTSGVPQTSSLYWNNTTPTSSVFTVKEELNTLNATYIALLFASVSGVSKVGTYTGNGTSQTINCGFTAGARYVLIKRTDTFSEWYVFDTARGITAGSDPYLLLSSSVNETTNVDTIDPDNSGFIIVQDGNTELNINNATYIYLAIA